PITLTIPIAGGNVVQTQGWPHGLPAVASGDFISIGTGRDTRLHQMLYKKAGFLSDEFAFV
ncbi:MAG: hypothetical protein MUQ36_00005, partial [Planktomarina temperata]|nr:hypothetical protein [Planktomarina temperata]